MAAWKRQKALGWTLRHLLSDRHWTVNDLSLLVGASPGYLHRVIQGRQDPTWSLVCALAAALEVTTDVFTDEPLQLSCPWCHKRWFH